MAKNKYYVVWAGYQPGVYDTWEECEQQVKGFAGAKFKAFDTCEDAVKAFRKVNDVEEMQFYTFLSKQCSQAINYDAFPEIDVNGIAVDGACDKPAGGNVEYRGVRIGTGEELFRVGPLQGGSNNIGEYLALVHVLALLEKQGDRTTPVYSDSRTAMSWLRRRHSQSTLPKDPNCRLAQILERADRWVATHQLVNPVIKWQTDVWGEIPADFGRK